MRILKRLFLAVFIVLVLAAGIGMLLPRQVHVERATTIDAPPATVFALVNGYRRFNEWSPWAALDPQAKYTISGPPTGVGAKMAWVGDPKKVGSGSQEILESRPGELVRTKLDFTGQGVSEASFRLAPAGPGTRVTWTFDTDMGAGPVGRWFGLFMGRMIGPDYEKGLAGLKKLGESMPKVDFARLDVKRVDVAARPLAVLATRSAKDPVAIGKAIAIAYGEIGKFMHAQKLSMGGAPQTIEAGPFDGADYVFEASIPVAGTPAAPVPADSRVQLRSGYAGPALQVIHKGAYGNLSATWEQIHAYMVANGLEGNGNGWEEYVTDPGSTPEADLVTHVFVPIKS